MAEPASSAAGSAAAVPVVVALLGTAAGDYAAIVFWALCGSLWPLSAREDLTRAQGAMMVLRLVVTSAAFSGLLAWWIGQHWGVPATSLLAPVALSISAFGDNWRPLISAAGTRLRALITGRPTEDKQ